MDKKLIEKYARGYGVTALETVDSTNTEAKRRAAEGEKLPHLVISESQSAGRGRLGRSFYSPESTGLYMSLAYRPTGDMTEAVKITSAAAVAVCRAIDEACGTHCGIKWVNDIYLKNKKVCGILTEATQINGETVIIVGVGVNCTTEHFPDELKERAGNIGKVCREELAAKIANYILTFTDGRENWIDEYRKRSLALGRQVTYIKNGEEKRGVAAEIDENGALLLEDGTLLSTGEITLRI